MTTKTNARVEVYVNKNQKKMRCGMTTGSCCSIAAKAATKKLLLGIDVTQETIMTPKGISISVPVNLVEIAQEEVIAQVFKDSGDDPDVTNGMEVLVAVSYLNDEDESNVSAMDLNESIDSKGLEQSETSKNKLYFADSEFPNIYLDGGIGVGRITKEGLEQKIGFAAINKVPRRMIMSHVKEIMDIADISKPILVTIIFPEGAKLAKRTFNPQLGIVDGISVLGTSGIVEPMSEKALIDTIEVEIKQKQAEGMKNIILMPGNYGQTYVQEELQLSLQKSVKCSNYVGESIDLCISYGMEHVLLVGNMGKFVKLAAGIMNTHSKVADGRMEILALHTYLCGGTKEDVDFILQSINTEGVVAYLKDHDLLTVVMDSICQKIEQHVKRRAGDCLKIGVYVFSENHHLIGKTSDADTIKDLIIGEDKMRL